ncbi:hypothetical protein [Enemella dayhoffiae]|uniref:hypothetical protein n=1 Tax=Enemella dayhoffiae TaxID=2016507 RepID=UPI001140862D|nr:hypothetical protein [Enemella dayhoffiae]
MREHVKQLLAENHGVIRVSQAGELQNSVRWLARVGELRAVLPGVLAPPTAADDHLTRARALSAACPDAVLTGRSAATLLGWGGEEPGRVTAAIPHKLKSHRGFALTRRRIDPEWIRTLDGIRVTNQFLTTVDLIPEQGGQVIDDLLRRHPKRGEWALDRLWQAHRANPRRPGNVRRCELLTDSADRPWSEAERAAHQLLRQAGITGWRIPGFTWLGLTERPEQFIDDVLTLTVTR